MPGRVVEDEKYATASRVFKDAKDAEANGGVRIYVPGYGDMMPSTSNAFVVAVAMSGPSVHLVGSWAPTSRQWITRATRRRTTPPRVAKSR